MSNGGFYKFEVTYNGYPTQLVLHYGTKNAADSGRQSCMDFICVQYKQFCAADHPDIDHGYIDYRDLRITELGPSSEDESEWPPFPLGDSLFDRY